MKRIVAIGLALALGIIAGSLACSGGGSGARIEIGAIALKQASFAQTIIDVQVRAENKTKADAVLERIEYDIYVGRKGKWIWLAREAEGAWTIPPGPPTDFTVTTVIEEAQLRRTIEEYIFGTEPTDIKVDGYGLFKMADDSIEVHFSKTTRVDTEQ
ncbi:MAG: hypothetical protein FJZ95_04105 [Chloroflexi bacterium]|nr:hypothetical protein [Chloroflexota bacterium]